MTCTIPKDTGRRWLIGITPRMVFDVISAMDISTPLAAGRFTVCVRFMTWWNVFL